MGKYPVYQQHDIIDCGPTCLKMVLKYFGKEYSLDYLRGLCFLTREGVSLLSINDAAESLGFRTMMAYLHPEQLIRDCPLPCILHWNQDHFVVLYEIRKHLFVISDPAHGLVKLDQAAFLKAWISRADHKGTVLLLEPSQDFYSKGPVEERVAKRGFLLRYLLPFKRYFAQLVIGMVVSTLIALSFPFLMQVMIDEGVSSGNRSIVLLVLLSQLLLFAGRTVIEVIRSWLVLHMNSRISFNIISDFLIKLLRLPIKFFDTKTVGDISQRINDHHRIENFLTGSVLNSFFSIVNIVFFLVVLAFYKFTICFAFISLSVIGVMWIVMFQEKRKQLDYKLFARNRENQDRLYEMITGMTEIKLYGSETAKRWEWERLQARYFKLNAKALSLEQYQQTGFTFITTLKNIVISFLAANDAINGSISLGVLLSISYIVGQTNGPVEQLVGFLKSAQDARLSMDRLKEIHGKADEEKNEGIDSRSQVISHSDIYLRNVSYQYEGPKSPFALNNISMTIPMGKITAIVGASGSGKTTLMKLLLGFYQPVAGEILVGDRELSALSPRLWRMKCGSVMQDGYIFYDTIARNIALDGNDIDADRMENAVVTANIKDFIEGLPLGYTTKIGASGVGVSGGQRQRILIARAVYKDPSYLLFDEATSSLDASNERVIMDNLKEYFKGRTVLIIAHRLSTVKNADQIIVLKNGRIAENGNHETLTKLRGRYFELVKNQLELGS